MNKKSKLIKPIAIITSLVVLLAALTFAWFITSPESSLSPFSAYAIEANRLEINNGSEYWGEIIHLENANVPLIPIAGNGVDFFRRDPVLHEHTVTVGGITYVTSGTDLGGLEPIEEPEAVPEHIKCSDMYVRSQKATDIFFDSENSYVVGAGDTIHCTCGAMRVSIIKVEENGTLTPLMIWFPNPQYRLTADATGAKTFTSTGEPQSTYILRNGIGDESFTTVSFSENEDHKLDGGILYVRGNPENTPALCNVSGDNVPLHLKMFVWLDGEDPECDVPFPDEAQIDFLLSIKSDG